MSGGYLQLRAILDQGSGATSGPVRVSYFDPRTGEPCDAKPEPLSERVQTMRSQELEGYRESLERGRKKRAVVVDGVRHESIAAAARAIGVDKTSLGAALRSGATEFRGRAVRYADPAQAPSSSPSNSRNSRAVTVDGERYASIADAAEAIGYNPTYLSAELRGGRVDYGGRVVRYADRPMPEPKPAPPKEPRRKPTPPRRMRPVTVDGRRYATVKDAAEAMGCVPGTIHNALKAGRDLVKGHAVAYA